MASPKRESCRLKKQYLVGFLCLGLGLVSSASRREELERAAELAVEKAAERVAERAVEKALESGNTTTESKIVRQSYTNVRKTPSPGYEEEDATRHSLVQKQEKQDKEDDSEEWYPIDGEKYRAWSSKLDAVWKRIPRSREEINWRKPERETSASLENISAPVRIEENVSYPIYEQVLRDTRIPVLQEFVVEKQASYRGNYEVDGGNDKKNDDIEKYLETPREFAFWSSGVDKDNEYGRWRKSPRNDRNTENNDREKLRQRIARVEGKISLPLALQKQLRLPVYEHRPHKTEASAFQPYIDEHNKHSNDDHPKTTESKARFGTSKESWRRTPRSGRSLAKTGWHEPWQRVVTIEKKIPVPVTIERKIPYPVYKHVPYEVKVPVPQPYTVEKKVPYPVKVFVNVPVEVPEPYHVEKRVPYEVKVDRPVPYKVEVPLPQPYTVEKKIPVEVKVPVPEPYTVDKAVPYEVKVPVKVPAPYEVERKVAVPVEVKVNRPYPVPVPKPYPVPVAKPYPVEVAKPYPVRIKVPVDKPFPVPVERPVPIPVRVPDPRPYTVEKPVTVEIEKPYPVPIKVAVDRPYAVPRRKPVPVAIEKPFPYFVQVPVPVRIDWRGSRDGSKGKIVAGTAWDRSYRRISVVNDD
ncbi:hypothetical protein KM043_006441 [Ampulex compressa]|nr:hypothetical protein KM043_006441 [Ampulex compressa]